MSGIYLFAIVPVGSGAGAVSAAAPCPSPPRRFASGVAGLAEPAEVAVVVDELRVGALRPQRPRDLAVLRGTRMVQRRAALGVARIGVRAGREKHLHEVQALVDDGLRIRSPMRQWKSRVYRKSCSTQLPAPLTPVIPPGSPREAPRWLRAVLERVHARELASLEARRVGERSDATDDTMEALRRTATGAGTFGRVRDDGHLDDADADDAGSE